MPELTIFQNIPGPTGTVIRCTSLEPGRVKEQAIKKAIAKGFTTLVAIEPNGNVRHYTQHLQNRLATLKTA